MIIPYSSVSFPAGVNTNLLANSTMISCQFFILHRIRSPLGNGNFEVARKLETISCVLLGLWIVSVLYNAYGVWLVKRTGIVQQTLATEEVIFIAGLVFIISQIFKRGVEIC